MAGKDVPASASLTPWPPPTLPSPARGEGHGWADPKSDGRSALEGEGEDCARRGNSPRPCPTQAALTMNG